MPSINRVEIKKIAVKSMPNGDEINIQIISVDSGIEGPLVHIQANVHGAEIQGNGVIFHLIQYFKSNKFCGKIQFIPCANPQAVNNKLGTSTYGRFNPITGDNWNRNYIDLTTDEHYLNQTFLDRFCSDQLQKKHNDIEITEAFKIAITKAMAQFTNKQNDYGFSNNKKINAVLQGLAAQSDIMLDLHTGPIACHYLYAAEYTTQDKQFLNFNFPCHIIIPNKFDGAMDEASFIPWIALQKTFQNKGYNYKIPTQAYTLELGSEDNFDLEGAQAEANCVLNFLQTNMKLNTKQQEVSKQYSSNLVDFKTYYAVDAGFLEMKIKPGQQFEQGDILGTIFTNCYTASMENLVTIKAVRAGILINHVPHATVDQGQEIIQVMENFF